jgi:uncharacterized protein
MMIYWAAFILGLGSAFHCIAMCGPLAMLVPLPRHLSIGSKVLTLANYHLWRIMVYVSLGLIAGILSNATSLLPQVVAHQQSITLGLGLLLLFTSLLPIVRHLAERWGNNQTKGLLRWLMGRYQSVRQVNPTLASIILGVLHGLVPCGIVYSAVIMSMLSGNALEAAMMMLVFGFATSMTLMVVRLVGAKIQLPNTRWIQVSLSLVAILLVLRANRAVLLPSNQDQPSSIVAVPCHK